MMPDARFVIACPTCQGRIAALVACAGRVGCCPLCAATLVVPVAEATAPSIATSALAAAAVATRVVVPDEAFAGVTTTPTPRPSAIDPALTFQEPVKSVAGGDRPVQLRRLTDEERRVRRARRNLVLLLLGGTLLIALTVAFGYRPGR